MLRIARVWAKAGLQPHRRRRYRVAMLIRKIAASEVLKSQRFVLALLEGLRRADHTVGIKRVRVRNSLEPEASCERGPSAVNVIASIPGHTIIPRWPT